jgi:hypothetical protein
MNAVIGRVQAVALARDLLSLSKQTGSVEFADYLRSRTFPADENRAAMGEARHRPPGTCCHSFAAADVGGAFAL